MKKYLPVLLAVACISPAQADTINLDLAGQVDMFHFRPIYQEFARLHTVYGTEQL